MSVSSDSVRSQNVSDEVKPVVALTFDDGPNASSTPILLDGLKERKVRATFFLIGENVEKDENEKIVKRMYEEGHLIGNHTYTHCNLSKLETGEAKKELEQTDTVIEKITGVRKSALRGTPGGQRTRSEQNIYRMDGGSTGLDDRRCRGGCKNSCGRDKSGRCYFIA